MPDFTSRERILQKIEHALSNKPDLPGEEERGKANIYKKIDGELEVVFKREFQKVNGELINCINLTDFGNKIKSLIQNKFNKDIYCIDEEIQKHLNKINISYKHEEDEFLDQTSGLTGCEYLIARLGSIMISSRQGSGRRIYVYPENHFVLAYRSQLVPDIKDAFEEINNKYGNSMPSLISLITGPSRTADIEKTLVMGAHGPKQLYVFLINDNN